MEQPPDKKEFGWKDYYEVTKEKPPSPLLVQAVKDITERHHALDLGAGALNDTRFLIQEGFDRITAVDAQKELQDMAHDLPNEKVDIVISPFDEFDFPSNTYDVINVSFSLPFNSPDTFDQVFQNISDSLKPHGVFVGQLFGKNDEWNDGRSMTFHSAQEAQDLLSGLEILYFNEIEKDSKIADGTPKHWHILNVIARKPKN